MELRTCHDVRHLTVCTRCKELGDKRDMIDRVHGRCFIQEHGLAALLKLSKSVLSELRLDDIGPDAMKAILDLWGPK